MQRTHVTNITDQEIAELLTRVDHDGAAAERRSNLVSILSKLLWLLHHADDPRDVAALEAQIATVDEILDGQPVA